MGNVTISLLRNGNVYLEEEEEEIRRNGERKDGEARDGPMGRLVPHVGSVTG